MKDNYALFKLCVEQFRKQYEYRQRFSNQKSFLKDNHLSLNMGRGSGHTSFIQNELFYRDDVILVYKNSIAAKADLSRELLKKAYSIDRPPRGLSLEKVKTIYVDRGWFQDSDYMIIDRIVDTGIITQVNASCIIVILG